MVWNCYNCGKVNKENNNDCSKCGKYYAEHMIPTISIPKVEIHITCPYALKILCIKDKKERKKEWNKLIDQIEGKL